MYGWYPLPFPLGGGGIEVPGPHCIEDADGFALGGTDGDGFPVAVAGGEAEVVGDGDGFPLGLVDGDGYPVGGTPVVESAELVTADADGFPVGLVDGDGGCCEGICGGA